MHSKTVHSGVGGISDSKGMALLEVQLCPDVEVQPMGFGTNHHSGRVPHNHTGQPTVGGIPLEATGSHYQSCLSADTSHECPHE